MKYILIAVGMIFLVTSCATQRRCAERFPCNGSVDTIVKDSVVYCVKDSIITIPPDSSAIQALIDCSEGQARLKQIIAYNAGETVKIPILKIRHDTLFVNCEADSMNIAFSWAEKNQYHLIRTSSVVVQKQNYLTGWQWFQLWTGRIFLILIIILLIYLALKYLIRFNVPFLK